MPINYQPVQGPASGNGAFAVNTAATNIASGFDKIGAGLTNLGKRRETRIDEENKRIQAKAEQQLGLLVNNAQSEEEVQQINAALLERSLGTGGAAPQGQSASVPTGQRNALDVLSGGTAALLASKTESILANDTVRGGNLETDLGNQKSQKELDDAALQDRFDLEYADTKVEMRKLIEAGNLPGAQALAAEAADRAKGEYGGDLAAQLFDDNITSFGSVTGAVNKNNQELAGVDNTRSQIRDRDNRLGIAQASEFDRNRDADAKAVIQSALDTKQLKSLQMSDDVVSFASDAMVNAPTFDVVIDDLRNNPNLSPEALVSAVEYVNAVKKENPNLLQKLNQVTAADIMKPVGVDPTKPFGGDFSNLTFGAGADGQFGKKEDVKYANIDPVTTAAFITNGANTYLTSGTTAAIYRDVQTLREQGNTVTDVASSLKAHFGLTDKEFPDKWLERINRAKMGQGDKRRALSDDEVFAIAAQSFGPRGDNLASANRLVPGYEQADQWILDVDKFDRLADAYASGSGDQFAATEAEVKGYASKANAFAADITKLKGDIATARKIGRQDVVNGLSAELIFAQRGLGTLEETMRSKTEARFASK